MFLENYRRDPISSSASRGCPGHPAPPSKRSYKNFLIWDYGIFFLRQAGFYGILL